MIWLIYCHKIEAVQFNKKKYLKCTMKKETATKLVEKKVKKKNSILLSCCLFQKYLNYRFNASIELKRNELKSLY